MKLFAATALLVAISATSVLAHDKSTTRLILEVQPGLCENTMDVLLNWGRKSKTIGAFALPSLKKPAGVTCDDPINAIAGLSENAVDQAEADALALEFCNKGNADNPLFGKCFVVGRLFTVAK